MRSINKNFWADPPWGDGNRKYRLGLSPIENEEWLNRKPDTELSSYKKNLLDKKYSELKDKLGNIGENKLLLINFSSKILSLGSL